MTAAARITQADMDRATKSVKNAGIEQAQIVMDLEKKRIIIIIGESPSESTGDNPWDDGDG